MSLAHLTDAQRAATIRLLCVDLDLDYHASTVEDVFSKVHALTEKAEKYDDLCR